MKKNIVKNLVAFTLYCSCSWVFAADKIDFFDPLPQTPSALMVDNISKPTKFNKSNNLLRKAGSFKSSVGDPLYIEGTIVDAFGIPIAGAIVKIWQTNAAGRYQSLITEYDDYYDPSFLTSGQSITDNTGKYRFLTLFPGYYADRAPHVNFIITHKKFGIIETEMYFQHHPRNELDPIYLTYPPQAQKALTAPLKYVDAEAIEKGKIATFNVVMDGIHQYKRF